MSLPGVVTLLIAAAATVAALLCIIGSLIFLAVPRLRHAAPYLGLVYPGAYLGALLGYLVLTKVVTVLLRFHGSEWVLLIMSLFAVACLMGGGAILTGFLGFVLASRVARHI